MRHGRLHGSGRSKPRGTSSAEFMLRTARLGAKPLATSKSPRESGLWSSIALRLDRDFRSEEHTSELQSLMRISYAVFCLKKKNNIKRQVDVIIISIKNR